MLRATERRRPQQHQAEEEKHPASKECSAFPYALFRRIWQQTARGAAATASSGSSAPPFGFCFLFAFFGGGPHAITQSTSTNNNTSTSTDKKTNKNEDTQHELLSPHLPSQQTHHKHARTLQREAVERVLRCGEERGWAAAAGIFAFLVFFGFQACEQCFVRVFSAALCVFARACVCVVCSCCLVLAVPLAQEFGGLRVVVSFFLGGGLLPKKTPVLFPLYTQRGCTQSTNNNDDS